MTCRLGMFYIFFLITCRDSVWRHVMFQASVPVTCRLGMWCRRLVMFEVHFFVKCIWCLCNRSGFRYTCFQCRDVFVTFRLETLHDSMPCSIRLIAGVDVQVWRLVIVLFVDLRWSLSRRHRSPVRPSFQDSAAEGAAHPSLPWAPVSRACAEVWLVTSWLVSVKTTDTRWAYCHFHLHYWWWIKW